MASPANKLPAKFLYPIVFIAFFTTALLSLAWGTESTSVLEAWRNPRSLDRLLLVSARLPRVLLASVTGGGLAVVGVAFQALLRNPLAEPYVLGVSGGAALGASLTIASGLVSLSWLGTSVIPLAAFGGGLLATVIVYQIARSGGSSSGATILLAGTVINALASALITFVKTLVDASKAQELLFWLMGFLDVPSWSSLAMVSLYVFAGTLVLWWNAGRLNLLALGYEPAASLGVEIKTLERHVFLAGSAIVGAVVSVTGLIGFIGLIVPHMVRGVLGPDHRRLIPISFVCGATTLMLCDLLSRLMFLWIGTEPPVGAITALIGGPLFLLLLRRGRQSTLLGLGFFSAFPRPKRSRRAILTIK
jgi:iron complex transport system permease protein